MNSKRLGWLLAASIVAGVGLLCSSGRAARADVSQFTVEDPRADAAPKIDGTLDDPEWQKAAHVELTWDYQFRKPASEKTDAYIIADAHYIYVAFVAEQSEHVTATLHTNDVTLAADDLVRTYLWPGGDHGFEYGFVSTPIGTRNEFSTENSSFAPRWTAAGKITSKGYTITEQIPLNVMRGDGRSTWRVQFERVIRVTNQDFEWAHDPSQNGVDSSIYVGYLNGMAVARASTRTKPRVGVYALGLDASPTIGGSTSHMGADLALPITNTTSFFGTIHPDDSNVDRDQQTISPTAFARFFQEVRPFFTQGSNFYNNFNCNDCWDVPFLYTPNIPTPTDGFAAEGVQGLAQFATFTARGHNGRLDDAQTFNWTTQDKHYQIIGMHFDAKCGTVPLFNCGFPGQEDSTSIFQAVVGNRHNSSFYVTEGGQHGNDVSDPKQAEYKEYGINLYTQKFGFFPAYHDIGPQFGPVDNFFQLNDLHGPTLFVHNEWDNAPTSFIQSINLRQDIEHFKNSAGQSDYGDAFTGGTIITRTQFQLDWNSGYQYLLLPSGLQMLNQYGSALSYGNNTNAPTSVSYNIGRFGPGYLRSTTRLTTLRLGPRGTLTLEGDNTNQTTDIPYTDSAGVTHTKFVQWLERASVAYQLGPGASLAVGVRRIIGVSPLVGTANSPSICNPSGTSPTIPPPTGFPCVVSASNVSFAYYHHLGQNELYVVYGDPALLSTYPALIVKFVHYFGAEKGT